MVRGSGPLRSMSGLGVGKIPFNSAHPYAQGWWGGGGEGAEAPLLIDWGLTWEGLGTARSRVVGVKKSDFQLDHVEEEFGAETFVRSYWSVAYMIAHPGFAGRALFTILDFHT